MSDLVGNPQDRFSSDEAHIYLENVRLTEQADLSKKVVTRLP